MAEGAWAHTADEMARLLEALQASEARNRALLSAVPDLLFRLDSAGIFIDHLANHPEELIVPPEQFLGRRVDAVLPAPLGAQALELVQRAIRTQQAQSLEYTLDDRVPPDSHHHYEARIIPSGADEALALVRDVTAQKHAEQTLGRYRLLADNSRDIILFVRLRDGRILEANRAAAEAYGYSHEELLGLSIYDLRHPQPRGLVDAQMSAAANAGGVCFQAWHRRRDGRIFPVEVSSQGTELEGEQVLLSIVRDISAHRRTEEKLRQISQRQQLLADVAAELLASDDPQSIVESLCRQVMAHLDCHAFFNYLMEEPQRRRLHLNACAGIPQDVADQIRWLELGVAVCGCVARDSCRIVAEDIATSSDPRTALVKSFGIQAYACHPLMAQGHLIGTLSFGTRSRTRFSAEDLELMKAVTDQVALAMERVRLLRAAEQRAAEAAQASRAKDSFLAVLSHELRTPLTPVLLTATLLEERRDLPEDVKAELASIRQNVQLEARLIDDLLDLTRIARGKLQFHMQPTDVHVAIRRAAEICGHGNDGAPIRLKLAAPRSIVHGDGARLQQVIWNLLNNARRATPASGTITVFSEQTADGRLRVQVRDTGCGIDPELLPRLFNAFEQGLPTADAASVRSSGTRGGLGLGLAISKAIVDAHGGTLCAHSDGCGRGATFILELPLACCPSPETPEPVPPAATTAQPASAKSAMRILLVEDHTPTLRVMCKLVERLGHQVHPAQSVESAMQAARQQRFDLLISDLGLPDGTGMDLMRQLRQQYGLRGIALSGYGMEDDIRQSREAGFSEHLIKPVDFKHLEAILSRAQTGDPSR